VNVSVSDIYSEFPVQLARTLASLDMPASRLVLGDRGHAAGRRTTGGPDPGPVAQPGRAHCHRRLRHQLLLHELSVHYQVHIIQIDRSFVRNLATSAQDQKIVRAIISMAADLDLSVITEGVETRNNRPCCAAWAACCSKAMCSAARSRPGNGPE
jgi:hypothetical protein